MRRAALAVAAVVLAFSGYVHAEVPWQSCPTPGTPCANGQDCVSATCTVTLNGETSSDPCNVCVDDLDPDCVGMDAGESCGDGRVCMTRGRGIGGGTTDGTESYDLTYSYLACVAAGDGDAGGPDANAGLSSEAGGGQSTDDARKTDTESAEESGNECALCADRPARRGTSFLVVTAALCALAWCRRSC